MSGVTRGFSAALRILPSGIAAVSTVDRKNTDHSVTIEDIIRMRLGVDISASDDTVNTKRVFVGSVFLPIYAKCGCKNTIDCRTVKLAMAVA
ncbi:MAG: hypothetical protein H6940_03165 [Burkholderiales bacterium]|nr:hypothetical protein [Burkholderiales bacterium]